MIREFSHSIAQLFPYRVLHGLVKPKIVAPFYHTVANVFPLHVASLYPVYTPEQFEQHLEFLLKHFEPTIPADVPLILSGKKKLAKPALFLSFDDGFKEVTTIVEPILSKKGIPATFFVNPNFIDNRDLLYRCKLSLIDNRLSVFKDKKSLVEILRNNTGIQSIGVEQIKEVLFSLGHNDSSTIDLIANAVGLNFTEYLDKHQPYLTLNQILTLSSKGYTIGAHSLTHSLFSELSFEQQLIEVQQSVDWVQQNIPNQPKLFAFPFTSHGVDGRIYKHFIDGANPKIDLMVGTSGYKPTNNYRFLHRIPMEVNVVTAKVRLKSELFYYLAKGLVGKHKDELGYGKH